MSKDQVTGKISRNGIEVIFNSLKTAISTKCEELLFDDFGVSGRAIATNILIIQPMDNIFEFEAMGISRVQELYSRLKLIIDEDDLKATYVEFREGKVGKLIFKTKKTKIEFRCKNPDMIKTKKIIKDPNVITFDLNEDAIRFMTIGTSAMKNPVVTFRYNDGCMYIRITDTEGDVLDHLITEEVDVVESEADEEVSVSYTLPRLAPILNAHRESTTVNISQRGVMNLSSDGFNIYLIPEI